MKRALLWLLLLPILFATGCATAAGARPSLPYRAWELGFVAPPYMEVWVETADVEDVRGYIFPRAGSGTASIGYSGNPAGWPQKIGYGGGRDVTGAALPRRIYVRWQSLAEPQTYRATLEITEEVRRLMLSREPQPQYLPEQRWEYRENLVVGLAPGGMVKLWVRGTGLKPIEVLCQQAEIVPEGPHEGRLTYGKKSKYWSLTERAKPYIDSHPIPYDSWKCPKASR